MTLANLTRSDVELKRDERAEAVTVRVVDDLCGKHKLASESHVIAATFGVSSTSLDARKPVQ